MFGVEALFDLNWYNSQLTSQIISVESGLEHFERMGRAERLSPHPLFDLNWYLDQYPDVAESVSCPVGHFLNQGWREGRDCHPLISTRYYLSQRLSGTVDSLLLHYLREGGSANIAPNPFFDASWYRSRYMADDAEITPLEHYILESRRRVVWPHPLFDPNFYLEKNIDVRKREMDPLSHYFRVGRFEGRNPNEFFDAEWYLRKCELENPPLLSSYEDAFSAYIAAGKLVHDPHPCFDTRWYASQNGVKRSEALAHYLHCSHQRRAQTHRLFDPEWYVGQLEPGEITLQEAFGHYWEIGTKLRLSPHPLFDPDYYCANVQRDVKLNQNPLMDYLTHGNQERSSPHPLFQAEYYISKYGNELKADDNPLIHLLDHPENWPNYLFDPDYYAIEAKDSLDVGEHPLMHYVRVGGGRGISPHPLFNSGWYSQKNPVARSHALTPLGYFFTQDIQKRSPHPLFDVNWYLNCNDDVRTACVDPLRHFLDRARVERHRSPSPLFDTKWYVDTYEQWLLKHENPLVNYLVVGASRGRDPNRLFSSEWYTEMHLRKYSCPDNPLVHWVTEGVKLKLRPFPIFDTDWYLKTYGDLLGDDLDPFADYLVHGLAAGRLMGPQDVMSQSRSLLLDGRTKDAARFLDFTEPLRLRDGKVTLTSVFQLKSLEEMIGQSPEFVELEKSAAESWPVDPSSSSSGEGAFIVGPRQYIAKIRKACAIGGTRILLHANQILMSDEMDAHWDDESIAIKHHRSVRAQDRGVIVTTSREGISRFDSGVHLMNEHANNYFHFIVEILTRLIAADGGNIPIDAPLFIDQGLHANFRSLLELLNVHKRPIIELAPDVSYNIDELYWVSDQARILDIYRRAPREGDTFLSKCRLGAVRNAVLQSLTNGNILPAQLRRRIYLRRGTGVRRLTNEAQIEEMLARLGFEILNLDGLSVGSQVQIFRDAAQIVAPTGAGLTNVLWVPPGCKVVVMTAMHPFMQTAVWTQLAAIAGAEIRVVTGRRAYARTDIFDVHDDFSVDVSDLLRAVELD